jgi:putative (di)nucleoside polyphosphate hydrolase
MTPPLPDEETFRAGVGMVVVDPDGRVLALERVDIAGAWQMPQGGLQRGETVEAAAWRELAEETGLGPRQVTLEDVCELWVGYELPNEYRKPKTGRGQTHRWLLFRLLAQREVPDLPADSEFRRAQWMTIDDLISRAAGFRRPEYQAVARWLKGRVA